MILVLVGPPGAGKGTQAARLAKHLGVPHCSTGELFRVAYEQDTEVGRQAKSYLDSGQLVPDGLVQDIVVERLMQDDCRAGCIMDGFPRTVPQAKTFDAWAKECYRQIDVVVQVKVDEQTLLDRLAGRGRSDDTLEVVTERLRQYDQLTTPLLDYYRDRGILRVVNGIGSLEEVFNRILDAINKQEDAESRA